MPLTSKGEEILANMRKEYGEKKGENVFYASKNAGKISGVDRADKISAIADAVATLAESGRRLEERMDAASFNKRGDSFKEVEKHAKKEGERDPAAVAAAVGFKKYGKEGMEEKAEAGRKDASKEYHDLESSFAKKTAQKALEAGDHDMAKKWVDYGTEHAKKSAEKAERIEGPPEDKKADKKK